MGITEVALLPLQEGKHPEDPSSITGQVHAEALRVLLSQPGVQRVYWGRQVENPLLLRWFVDWDDLEDHKRFMKSSIYKSFLQDFGNILNPGAQAYHAHFNPHPPIGVLSNRNSPVTEIVTMWFPTMYTQEDQNKVLQDVKTFLSILEEKAKGCKGSAVGWVDEEIELPGEDGKWKAFLLLVGWDSVESHTEFQSSQAFKDNIHHVLGAKGLQKIEAVHSSLKQVTRTT